MFSGSFVDVSYRSAWVSRLRPGDEVRVCVRAYMHGLNQRMQMYFWQRCRLAAELFTLIPLLMAAGCQSGCRSLQAQMWPLDFWEGWGGGLGKEE